MREIKQVKRNSFLVDTIASQQTKRQFNRDFTMFGTAKTDKLAIKPQLMAIRWYPSSRCFGSSTRRKSKLNLMPPLMVRKAEWRR